MRVTVAAVGRGRGDPCQALFQHYTARLGWPVRLAEVSVPGKAPPAERRAAEAKRLLAAVPEGAAVVALDARGKALTSEAFARALADWQDGGVRDVAFLVGGAEGLDESVRARADLVLSLGPMTWPHMMVRAMLAEQLYRARAILSGHPYHRA